MKKLLVGPLLGIESNTHYTICFSTAPTIAQASVELNGETLVCSKVGETPSSQIWRAETDIAPGSNAQTFTYRITADGQPAQCHNKRSEWCFYSPGTKEKPTFAYVSCNGFSSLDLMHKTQQPYGLWEHMQQQHNKAPISALLMGGDQLYADSIWMAVPELKRWNALPHKSKVAAKANKIMRQQIDRFYDSLYQERWTNEAMSLMLASIPSVMMWDDHDIFDGWGSFPNDIQQCEVFQTIFQTAKKYFELFQIRSRQNTSLLDNQADHYAFALTFRDYHILALDNRTERTLDQVMGNDSQWPLINDYLKNINDDKHLLVMSAVPVVYRDFSCTEALFDATPWEEELTDDLKDHWRSKNHEGERARLIHRLLDNVTRRMKVNAQSKTVILSGDVHIGCIGVIHDQACDHKIHQIVSSGIVHPAPSRLQWIGIMAVTNDRTEYLDENRNIRIAMLKPFASNQYIRCRNYVTLSIGSDQKLWVNWQSEGKDQPYYPIQ